MGKKKFLETNDNENMTTENLWDAAKAVLRRKFISIQSYLKKQQKHQIDDLTLHLILGREEQTNKNPQNQQKDRNHKDPSRNKCNKSERNNSKD